MAPFNPNGRARDAEDFGPTNGERADNAQAAINAWRQSDGRDPDPSNLCDTDVRDLIADLLHLAHRQGLDVDNEKDAAYESWAEESRNLGPITVY